jgi:hypothetical protein
MTGAAAFMDGLVQDAATLVPEDLVLPHLAEALDPVAMLTLFRRNMTTAGGFGIEACMVDRIRYRRGARAVVQYTARLVGPSGEQREQWITALLYPRERARQVWGKLETSMPTIAAPGAVLPPVAFDSDSRLILQVFPVDRRLPSLPTLFNPERLKSVLPRSRAGANVWTAEAVRYRAGLGCALRWGLDAPSNGSDRWYVKAYRDLQGARTHRALLALGSALSGRGFTVPEPVAYLEDHRALVQEEVSGRSVADVLLARDDAAPVMERVAETLATFHREVPAPARRRTKSDELDDVRRAAALVTWVRPALTDTVQGVVACVAEGLDDVKPAATHGDLNPDHIVLSGDSLTVLDLDWFAGSDPVTDVGSMIARLTGMAYRRPQLAPRIEVVGRAFADAYFARVPSTWQRRFPPHHAAALLHEAGACFRHQLPNWPHLMDSIVQRAMEVLSR